MANKPDDALEEVSQTTELSPELIQFKTLLESTFIDVELAFVMTDQIPSVVVPKESLHDLCVFLKTNSVYDSKIPIISAIGHETIQYLFMILRCCHVWPVWIMWIIVKFYTFCILWKTIAQLELNATSSMTAKFKQYPIYGKPLTGMNERFMTCMV